MGRQTPADDATDVQTEIAQSAVVLSDDVARELDDPIQLDHVYQWCDSVRGEVWLDDGSVVEIVLEHTDDAGLHVPNVGRSNHITDPIETDEGATLWERTEDN